MGGCRCTYRNCTVRSDRTTHMFHYPVFDKVRCHQWLTHAHKLNFLNLKVSQLKNRVICQHHFKDEYFMNFRKDKLTFEAIPTLDGPFCDSSQYTEKDDSQEVAKMYPISLDDIETEYLTLYDKKANFSVKYGDFLTNCELMDADPVNTINNKDKSSIKCVKIEPKNEELSYINIREDANKVQNTTINLSNNESPMLNTINISNDTKQIELELEVVQPNNMYRIINPAVLGISMDNSKLPSKNKNDTSNVNITDNNVQEEVEQTKNVSSQNITETPKKQRVKIISEKKIVEPVTLTGKLEPMSPSLILHLPNKRKITTPKPSENDSLVNVKSQNETTKPIITPLPSKNNDLQKAHVQTSRKVLKNTINNEVSPSKSLLKPKVNSDRVAAIERKRKFNMKLRDIIELSLDKMDEQNNEPLKSSVNNNNNERVSSFLSKNSGLPSVQHYTIACLEARLKRMEDILLNKIDQNTQKIMELKNSLVTPSDKRTVSTQVIRNEEHHKKQLYTEISKYLSPDANNLIYEELFINKYVQNTLKNAPSPKKRRRR